MRYIRFKEPESTCEWFSSAWTRESLKLSQIITHKTRVTCPVRKSVECSPPRQPRPNDSRRLHFFSLVNRSCFSSVLPLDLIIQFSYLFFFYFSFSYSVECSPSVSIQWFLRLHLFPVYLSCYSFIQSLDLVIYFSSTSYYSHFSLQWVVSRKNR